MSHTAAMRRRYLTIAALCAPLGIVPLASSGASAQTPFTPGIIAFAAVEGKPSPLPGAEGLHWVANVATADVRVDDPELKSGIAAWLAEHAADDHDWLLDPRTEWSFFEAMVAALPKYELRRTGTAFRSPPEAAEPTQAAQFGFEFRKRPPPPSISEIVIELRTEAAMPAGVPTTALDLGTLSSGVSAQAIVATAEIAASSDRDRLSSALKQLAVHALELATSGGVRVGAAPDEQKFRAVEQALVDELIPVGRLNVAGRPTPNAAFKWLDPLDQGRLQLLIRNVRVLETVVFDVRLIQVDTVNGSSDAIEHRQKNATIVKAQTEAQVLGRLASQIDALRHTVPTNERLQRIVNALDVDRSLRPPVEMIFEGQTLRFLGKDNRARFGFDAVVAGGWSVEDGVFGKGSFTAFNLLRLSQPTAGRAETESISFSGLNETQRFALAFAVETSKNLAHGATVVHGVHADAGVARDSDQLFGNAAGSRLSYASRSFSPSYDIAFTSATRDREENPTTVRLASRTGFGPTMSWGRVVVEEGAFASPAPAIGSYAGVTASQTFQAVVVLRPPERPGVGEVRAAIDAKWLYAPDWLDFSFSRLDAAVDLAVVFGVAQSRDYLVRYRAGGTAVTSTAPLFEFPRLGGDRTRGIEEGELVDRHASYAQLTAGPSLEHLITWFGKKRPENGRLGPLRLADIYLAGFVDRGAVFSDGGFSDWFWPTGATGYGVAAELQSLPVSGKRARLTIGYARSPDSARHRRGVVVTAIAFDL
jgi:hypothetical protein